MRTALLLLLLANLGFFAWSYTLAPGGGGGAGLPVKELAPERLKIVSAPKVPAASASATKDAPASPIPAAAPAPAPTTCLEWGSFALADAGAAARSLTPLALGERLIERRTLEQAGWWVFIPPQGGRSGAQKKAAELKSLGVEDYFVVQDEGPVHWAVSLGVFRSEEAAKARLEALRDKKVRSAQIGPREMKVPKIWLQVREADTATAARLRELAQGVQGSEVRDCPKPG